MKDGESLGHLQADRGTAAPSLMAQAKGQVSKIVQVSKSPFSKLVWQVSDTFCQTDRQGNACFFPKVLGTNTMNENLNDE